MAITYQFYRDQAMTQLLPLANGTQQLKIEYNGAETKIAPIFFGSTSSGHKLALQDGVTDTAIVLSVTEKPQPWLANTNVRAGQIIQPSNGKMYKARNAGTTGATSPAFPTTTDLGVNDGTTYWTCLGDAFDQSQIQIGLSATGVFSSSVNLGAELLSGTAVAIHVKATNTSTEMRSDESDCIVMFSINKVIEKKV